MKIGIIASVRHPIEEPFAGGLEMHTYLLAQQMRAREHEVVVFASATSDERLGVEPISEGGAPLFSASARRDPSMLAEPFMEEHHAYLDLMMRLPSRGFDVVHNNALHYLPVAMAAALPCPFVTTLHTPPTPWLESAMKCACTESGTSYVSVSASNANAWEQSLTASNATCEVIPNGIDLHWWSFASEAEPGLAAWSGRIVSEKGTHLAVEAAHAAGLRIVLAGPLHDRAYFDEEVAPRLGPDDRYVGHLDHAALSTLIGRAGVFLCTPCWDEPFGLVVAEALACGTPVAAFDRGAMSEILDASTGRLAPPGDACALGAAALEAQRLDRTACRRRAEQHCSAQVMVDRYERLYARLMA